MAIFCGVSFTASNQRCRFFQGHGRIACKVLSATFTLRASRRKRVPAHSGQALLEMYLASSSRTASESVSCSGAPG